MCIIWRSQTKKVPPVIQIWFSDFVLLPKQRNIISPTDTEHMDRYELYNKQIIQKTHQRVMVAVINY